MVIQARLNRRAFYNRFSLFMADYPSINDRKFDLWKKIAWNLYDLAVEEGVVGLNPPSVNDRLFDLQKKATYYSAALAAI